jgi:hypothetical protein
MNAVVVLINVRAMPGGPQNTKNLIPRQYWIASEKRNAKYTTSLIWARIGDEILGVRKLACASLFKAAAGCRTPGVLRGRMLWSYVSLVELVELGNDSLPTVELFRSFPAFPPDAFSEVPIL